MSKYYTIPTVSSLNDNKVDLLENRLEELRVLRLEGDLVRLRVDENYIECDSYEDVDLSKYAEVFEKISKLFYSIGYLFGCVNNGNLVVYDIYTNENYFSSKDLNLVSRLTGLPIAKPLLEGRITLQDVAALKEDNLYVLPAVYIDIAKPVLKSKSKIVFGERPTYNYNYSYGVYNKTTNTYDYTKPKDATPKDTTPAVSVSDEFDLNKKTKKEVFTITTKDERTAIFNETYKNVSNYVNKNKFSEETMKWWKTCGKFFTYLYAIHTLPTTRHLVWDYIDFEAVSYDVAFTVEDKEQLSWLLSDYFWEYYRDIIPKKYSLEDDFSVNFFVCFEEELEVFLSFYKKESLIAKGKENVQC